MKTILAVLLLCASALAFADTRAETELAQLQQALNRVQQEQQSVYQQFQMTQEMRRNELQQDNQSVIQRTPYPPDISNPPSYEDNQRIEQERQARIQRYSDDLNRLYQRYLELGEQKEALLSRIAEVANSQQR